MAELKTSLVKKFLLHLFSYRMEPEINQRRTASDDSTEEKEPETKEITKLEINKVEVEDTMRMEIQKKEEADSGDDTSLAAALEPEINLEIKQEVEDEDDMEEDAASLGCKTEM
jgi:hypothetical protein